MVLHQSELYRKETFPVHSIYVCLTTLYNHTIWNQYQNPITKYVSQCTLQETKTIHKIDVLEMYTYMNRSVFKGRTCVPAAWIIKHKYANFPYSINASSTITLQTNTGWQCLSWCITHFNTVIWSMEKYLKNFTLMTLQISLHKTSISSLAIYNKYQTYLQLWCKWPMRCSTYKGWYRNWKRK